MRRVMNKVVSSSLIVLSLAVASQAAAEPLPLPGYVAAGGEIGVALNGGIAGATVSGGYQITDLPLYARAQIAAGSFNDVYVNAGSHGDDFYQGEGRFAQLRLGTEYLPCTLRGWLCGLVGADLGVLRTGATEGHGVSSHYTQEQFVPRLGLDVGTRHLRARATADLALGFTQRETASGTTSESGFQSFVLGAAIAYRF